MTLYHYHHIWPRHAIGPPPKDNIIRVDVANHAFLHHLQWLQWGRWEDKVAWLGLSGQITEAEIIRQKMIAANAGKPKPPEQKQKIATTLRNLYKSGQLTHAKGFAEKKHSEKTKLQMKINHVGMTGQPRSIETKQKISNKLKGRIPWNKGRTSL